MDFATVQDIRNLWRPLTPAETERAENLLPIVSDLLRIEAENRGYDLDQMVSESPALASVATLVTVDILGRTLSASTTAEPMQQVSQSALGYSWSGTYAVPGGGVQIMRRDLQKLGIMKQKLGVIELGHHRYHCADCE